MGFKNFIKNMKKQISMFFKWIFGACYAHTFKYAFEIGDHKRYTSMKSMSYLLLNLFYCP